MVPEPGSRLVHSYVSCVKTVVSARTYDVEGNTLEPDSTPVPEHSTQEPEHNKPVRAHNRRAGNCWIELGRTNRRRQIAA